MSIFVLSHNLQVQSDDVPPFTAVELSQGLMASSASFSSAEALSHPHWLVRLESNLDGSAMAEELVRAWKHYRENSGHSVSHSWLALGGRKDSDAMPGSPLQNGYWGVDVVECENPDQFLQDINWNSLKGGRSPDAVFEIRG